MTGYLLFIGKTMSFANQNSESDNQHQESQTNNQFIKNTSRGIQLNQRPTSSYSIKSKPIDIFKAADQVVQESGWTLDDIMHRLKYLNTIPYPIAATSHTILAKYRVPQDLYANNAATQSPFQNFIFWNGDVRVHAQITASPTASGCVIMAYIPLTDPRAIESNLVPNFSALTVNQCSYLFPNTNTSAEMVIKYNSPYSNLKVSEPGVASQHNTLGYLYFIVLNPLQLSANSSDNIAISVFTEFMSNQFKVPKPAGVTLRKVKAQGKHITSPKPVSHGLIEDVARLVLPDEVVGDVIDVANIATTGMKLLGLDKPVVATQEAPTKILTTQYMNFSKGPDYVDKMTWDPSHVSTVDQNTFATLEDEMDMGYLTSKFSYLGSFNMTTSNAIGATLASFPMNPCPTRIQNGSNAKVSLLQYLSTPYQYWSGGLTYKFQVVSTMMQTGKLLVALNYDEYLPDTTINLNKAASQYGQVVEINQGSNTFVLTADYLAPTPLLHVPNSNQPSSVDTMGMINISVLNPLVSTNGAPTQITINVFVAGSSSFRLSTLTSGKNLQPFVPIQLATTVKQQHITYVEEEEEPSDVEVEYVEIIQRKPKLRVVGQASVQPTITPISEVDMVEEENVISKSQSTSEGLLVSQSYISNLRDVLRKYQMHSMVSPPEPTDANVGNVFRIPISSLFGRSAIPATSTISPLQAENMPLGLFTHHQLMYRQFKGGFNFKIMSKNLASSTSNNSFSVFYQPPVFNKTVTSLTDMSQTILNQLYMKEDGNIAGYNVRTSYQHPYLTRLPVHYTNSINQTAEFHVPYTSRYLSVLSTLGPNTENELFDKELTDLGTIYIYYVARGQTTQYFDIFFSLSDEARFGTLFNVPQLSVYSYVNSTTGVVISSAAPDDYGTGAPVVNSLIQL